jgi:hypothetical protein
MGETLVLDPPSEDDEPPPLAQSSSDDEEASSAADEDDEPPPLAQCRCEDGPCYRFLCLSYPLMGDHGPHFYSVPSYHAYNRADEAGAMDRNTIRACVAGAMDRNTIRACVIAASREGSQEPMELSPGYVSVFRDFVEFQEPTTSHEGMEEVD